MENKTMHGKEKVNFLQLFEYNQLISRFENSELFV